MKNSSKKTRDELIAKFEAACADASSKRDKHLTLRHKISKMGADEKAALRDALIADLRRVYEDPLNPYAGFAASRKRYRQLGHYPEILVVDFFGNHEEFLRAADLADKRNTTRVRNRGARLHTHQQIAAYADRHLKPFDGAFQNPLPDDVFHVVVGSDFHGDLVDPFALRVFLDVIRMVKPEVVGLNGDVVDFPQVSRHRQLPGHFHLNLQQEIDAAREKILRPVREAAGDANILFVIGNHEYRLVNYLADTAPVLAGLKVHGKDGEQVSVGFDSLFGLEALKIGLVCRQSFLAPFARDRKRDHMQNWAILGDCFVLTHGTSIAKVAASAEMERYRMSGTSGHTHRPQIVTDNALGTGALNWTSTPMMAAFAVGKDYVPNPSNWNMGFAVFTVDRRQRLVVPQLVLIHENFATFAGQVWTPTKAEKAAREKMLRVEL